MAKQVTCHSCVYAHWDPGLWMRTLWSGFAAWPSCGNQPDSYGRMKECPREVCRNYRARPPVPKGENVKTIPLGEGLYAYVDAEDYDRLSQRHWRFCNGYAGRQEKGKLIFMHHQILSPSPGKVTDHISGNKLDNTRANLRNVTPGQNVHNKAKHFGSASIYKGVFYEKRRHQWQARIYLGKRYFFLGRFDTEVEAARAYDRGAVEVFGEFARLNFPEEWPLERRRKVHAKWQRQQARQRSKAGAGRQNVKSRTKAPAREGSQRATRNAKRVTRRTTRKASSRVQR
jgi:hypothetical protein